MIICGYAGIGKSWLGHNMPGVMDLESTPFQKDWATYCRCAMHYHSQGYLVLLSCHREIREAVHKAIDMCYFDEVTFMPDPGDKELYMKKYEERGNTPEFIRMQSENWDRWLDERSQRIIAEHWEYLRPGENLYQGILRLSDPNYSWKYCAADPYCVEMPPKCPAIGNCYNPFRDIVAKWPWDELRKAWADNAKENGWNASTEPGKCLKTGYGKYD